MGGVGGIFTETFLIPFSDNFFSSVPKIYLGGEERGQEGRERKKGGRERE